MRLMKKVLVFAMTLLLSLAFVTASYAGVQKTVVFCGNAQSGSIGDGQQGYSWYRSGGDSTGVVKLIKINFVNKYGHWKVYRDNEVKPFFRSVNWCRHWNRDFNRDGEWNYYIDANGVSHYFYIDPDHEYEWNSYKDKDGNTQYYCVNKGWKR